MTAAMTSVVLVSREAPEGSGDAACNSPTGGPAAGEAVSGGLGCIAGADAASTAVLAQGGQAAAHPLVTAIKAGIRPFDICPAYRAWRRKHKFRWLCGSTNGDGSAIWTRQ